MRIAFAGTPAPAVAALAALRRSHHEIALVVTRPDAPKGRGRVMTPSPVARAAEGLDCRKPGRISDLAGDLAAVDCVVVVAYGGMVPPDMLAAPRHGYLNVHYSLLPAWRGAAPVQHAVLHGDVVTGASVFRLDEGLDTGPVMGTVATGIAADETSTSLLARLSDLGAGLLLSVLDAIDTGQATAVAQPSDGVSYAPKVTAADARIRWHDPASAVDRRIRAMTEVPGAWTMVGDDRIKIGPVRLRPEITELGPGETANRDGAVVVGTASHAVELVSVQHPGRTWGPPDARLSARSLS